MPKPEVPANLTVDFSNVEERREGGGRAANVPDGDYLLKITGVQRKSKKEDSSSFYLNWQTSIVAPAKYAKAGNVYHITSLKEENLWNLRNFLEDLGLKVPKSALKIPLQAIVSKGLIIGATLEGEEYNGKVKSKIVATFKKSEYEATGDEDDADEEETDDEEVETAQPAATEDEEDLEELELDDL